MSIFTNPSFQASRQTQAGLYYARRRRATMVLLQSLTEWEPGLIVTAGQYVSSENGTAAFLATSSGTTGAIPPTGQSTDDGGVTWVRADTMSLLQFLYVGVPTP